MNKFNGKRILIFQQRNWAKTIGHFLAKKLQDEGCQLAAITLKKSTHKFILDQKEVKYDLVISDDEILNNPKDYLAGDKFSLKQICNDLGIETVWPLVTTIRNYVKCYKDKYYYSFKQNVPDEQIIDYTMAVYKCIKIIFNKFKPDLIIAPNFVVMPHIMLSLYAKRHGIKMFAVTDTKVKGIYIFTYDFEDSSGPFFDYLDALNKGLRETQSRNKARKYIQEFRQKFIVPVHATPLSNKKSLKQIIRHELSPYYHSLRWYIKKPNTDLPNLGPTIDYRPPRILFRDHYVAKRYKKFMDNFDYYPLSKIGKYAYFPLQYQPEASIDVIAPYFSNQIETARQVAMSLPDGYTLVVKEHPAMVGLRPSSYIEKIIRTPNIKLIDYRISSAEVLKKADLVVSPNSTTLAEAAFYYKPAIQLGNLGITLRLPNVFQHTDMTTLSCKIKELLKVNLENKDYDRKLENFIATVYDTGFDFNYTQVWAKGRGGDMNELWKIYRHEIESALK